MSEKESAINAGVLGEEAALSVKDRLGLADAEDDVLPLPPALTLEQERKLWRKIDRRLLPILTLMYLCSFLDHFLRACDFAFVSSTVVKRIYNRFDILQTCLVSKKCF